MHKRQIKNIALMAIKPVFAEGIFSQSKKVEFRKVRFSEPVERIVIYASSPIKKILGWFEVDYIEEACPSTLWRKHKEYAGIDRADFFQYFSERKIGYAIGIKKVVKLEEPLTLSSISRDLRVPQSFSYFPEKVFQRYID